MIAKDDLNLELMKIYNFGYSSKNGEIGTSQKIVELFNRSLKEYIFDRIGLLYDLAEYVIIEENYVESEWKEMISKHYIHSAYSSTLRQKVIRIHFLSNDDFSEENYLGFITLRPLEEISIALSFIYVNWKHKIFSDSFSYVMTYEKEVHYKGKSITIHTYPFFAQDSIVTCCADANVIMLTKYFANKFNFTSIGKISSFFSNVTTKHQLPKKVNASLLQRMLSDSDISFRVKRYYDAKKLSDNSWDRIQKYINTYIESGLPVILGLDGHVVQLIGHVNSNNDLDRKYIVYDDSGHLEKLCNENPISHRFCYLLSINDIKKYLNDSDISGFFILMSEYEKVYIDFERYQLFLVEYLLQFAELDKKKTTILSHIFDNKGEINNNTTFRNMLIDNSVFKEFLLEQNSLEQEQFINDILSKELPHYLWYTEITVDNKTVCLCADPTMYYDTRDIEKLFFYSEPIGLLNENSLSLLTECK